MIESTGIGDDSNEDTLRAMVSDFYSRRMRSAAILVWVNFLFFFTLAIISIVQFSKAEQTRSQIMYAALFVCFMQFSTLAKILAWLVIQRNSIKRATARLEVQLADISRKLEKQPGA